MPRPLYEQVAAALRLEITHGHLAPGDLVPSESRLQATYKVSRDTVRKALDQLAHEGLLEGRRGQSRRVRQYAPLRWDVSTFDDPLAHATEPSGLQGSPRSTGMVKLDVVVPPVQVATLLKLGTGEPAARRTWIRVIEDRPHHLIHGYFPYERVRDTALTNPRTVALPGGDLAALTITPSRYVIEIAARMPTRSESDQLHLSASTPVAELTRAAYAEDGSALQVMVGIAPGDRAILSHSLNTL